MSASRHVSNQLSKSTWLTITVLLLAAACVPGGEPTTGPPTETAADRQPVETADAGTAAVISGEPPDDRGAYRQSQPEETPGFAEFLEAYETARAEQADWVRDPVAVALRLTGYPNSDEESPDQVTLYQTGPERLTVVLLLESARDDSVRDIEDRIDLIREGDVWRVEWAGARWRCQPGRGQQDWGIELCI